MAKLKKPKTEPDPIPLPPQPSPGPVADDRSAFVACAEAQVGKKYVWASAGPETFDCSGLVSFCYRKATGRDISRSSHAQFGLGTKVNKNALQPGDLVFYDTMGDGAGHVGIVTGQNRAVHALNERMGVRVTAIEGASLGGPFVGARRLDLGKSTTAIPVSPGTVNPSSPFREVGNTDYESFEKILSRTVTPGMIPPPLAEAKAIYDILVPKRLARLGAGMAWIERSNDTNDDDWETYYGPDHHNLWAVKDPRTGKFKKYRSYAEATKDWVERILGPTYADLTSIAEFIARYAPWSDGNNPDQYGQKLSSQINLMPLAASPAEPVPPAPGEDFKVWTIPGIGKLQLPKAITVEIDLTPVGVHRPGRVVTMTGSTLHETGNRGNGTGARMHSTWQDGCTPGHPNGYVGVSMYIENRLVLVKIPFNESSIHSGDWRNNAHPSMEVCVNADRNAEQTEDTAMWVQAAILFSRGQNAKDHLYPHTPSGCPAIINAQGRWPSVEREVDRRIGILDHGGSIPSEPEYAKPIPIPRPWDGTDYTREDGHVFVALSRVFVARVKTAARQTASPTGRKVRADLNPGEGFLSHYVTVGGDNKQWLLSQYGSRIAAADCLPPLSSFGLTESLAELGFQAKDNFSDPSRGLSAEIVPEDAPSLSKAEFMKGTP